MAQPPANQNDINRALQAFFRNGLGEAGLEVGTDPGLPFDHHIKIPACMKRRWIYRFESDGPAVDSEDFDDLIANYDYREGTNSGRTVVRVDGRVYVTHLPNDAARVFDDPFELPSARNPTPAGPAAQQEAINADNHVSDIKCAPAELAQIAAFVEVNTAGATSAGVPAALLNMAHATRYWAVVAGWVTTSRGSECEEVANPAALSAEAWTIAQAVAGMASEAFTASAARGASWRKTNHCTGGEVAQGLPRRWLDKNGMWGTGNDENQTKALHRSATSAFYFAAHAVSNHAILAALAPDDPGHWSRVDASYGYIVNWAPGDSVKLRIAGMTQVAGAAIVADSVEVLRMTIKERLSPLINSRDNVGALMAAHATVTAGGIAVHVGARWFLYGHPKREAPAQFSQKDSAHFTIASELAVIATTYYARTTIGRSMALKNAADQCSDEMAKSTWSSLAANRTALAAAEVIKAVARIKGAAAVGAVKDIVSDSEASIRTAVGNFNVALRADAAAAGVAGNLDLDVDRIVNNAKDAANAAGTPLGA